MHEVFGAYAPAAEHATAADDDPLALEFDLDDGFDQTIQKVKMLREMAQGKDDDERRQIAAHVSMQFAKMLGITNLDM